MPEPTGENPGPKPRKTKLPVSLQPIDRDNWQYCIHLELDPEQRDRLATNLYSLAQAYVEPECTPRAIYAGQTMIGFVMYEYEPYGNAYNIPRFMIDRRWQGRGYGAHALRSVLDALKAERPEAAILITLTPDNKPARKLYLRLGFKETGQQIYGEDLLRHP